MAEPDKAAASEEIDRLADARLRGLNESLERQVAERTATLRESEQRFRDVAEVAGDWIWESDRDHRFTFFAGESLEAMAEFGAAPQLSIGKTRWELAGGDPERDAPAQGGPGRAPAVPEFPLRLRYAVRRAAPHHGQRQAGPGSKRRIPGLPWHRHRPDRHGRGAAKD
jgi:sigma-B regulation protein RsbU (phosphoserine phosphatase)